MKYLTIEHMKKLDALKLERYLRECVEKLEGIAYQYAFEEKIENYHKFVEHVYNVAKQNGITNKKHIFSLMLLWHVEGDSINEDKTFLEVLDSKTIHNHEKSEYFKYRAIRSMKGKEA